MFYTPLVEGVADTQLSCSLTQKAGDTLDKEAAGQEPDCRKLLAANSLSGLKSSKTSSLSSLKRIAALR